MYINNYWFDRIHTFRSPLIGQMDFDSSSSHWEKKRFCFFFCNFLFSYLGFQFCGRSKLEEKGGERRQMTMTSARRSAAALELLPAKPSSVFSNCCFPHRCCIPSTTPDDDDDGFGISGTASSSRGRLISETNGLNHPKWDGDSKKDHPPRHISFSGMSFRSSGVPFCFVLFCFAYNTKGANLFSTRESSML